MLLSGLQRNIVRNPGQNAELDGAYYVSAAVNEIKLFKVQWFFHTNNMNLTNLEEMGVIYVFCGQWLIMMLANKSFLGN